MRILLKSDLPIRCVAYSPAGGVLACGGPGEEVSLLETATGQLVRGLPDHKGGVETLAFAPDSTVLAVGTGEGQLLLWNPQSGEKLLSAQGHASGVRCVAFAPDSPRIVTAGWDRRMLLWRYNSLLPVEPTPFAPQFAEGIAAVAFHPDGSEVVVASWEGSIRWLDSSSGEERCHRDEDDPFQALAVSPDGRWTVNSEQSGAIDLWTVDGAGAGRQWAFATPLLGHEWVVFGLAFTPDSKRLISGGADGTVRVWDVAEGEEIQAFRWHTRWVTCVAVSPDGMTAVAGSDDGTVVMWDLADV